MKQTIVTMLLALVVGTLLAGVGHWAVDVSRGIDTALSRTAPVVADMRVAATEHTKNALFIHVFGKKLRDCGPPIATSGYYGGLDAKQLDSIQYMDDVTDAGEFLRPDSNAIPEDGSEIDFGWWKIRPNPGAGTLHLFVIHKCDGVLVQSSIGTFIIK